MQVSLSGKLPHNIIPGQVNNTKASQPDEIDVTIHMQRLLKAF